MGLDERGGGEDTWMTDADNYLYFLYIIYCDLVYLNILLSLSLHHADEQLLNTCGLNTDHVLKNKQIYTVVIPIRVLILLLCSVCYKSYHLNNCHKWRHLSYKRWVSKCAHKFTYCTKSGRKKGKMVERNQAQ